MFQITPDQTQWFHLYRVQKVYPITFVLFACDEAHAQGTSSRLLDLRIVSGEPNVTGGSWCVKDDGKQGKPLNRADCAKFLELYARFSIAHATRRGIDEIEFVESSREELAMAASLDDNFKRNLEAMAPTLLPKLARNMIRELGVNQTGFEFEELPDWPTRNAE